MKILHLISQRPELTGSGMYLQAVMREATRCGHENFLVAGIPGGAVPALPGVDGARCLFVSFDGEAIPFPVVGMSDVMPYKSRRFSELYPEEMATYEAAFSDTLTQAVSTFAPDMIHSHHLWVMSALARDLFPDIPMVTSCHGTDLRQFQTCPHLAMRVGDACRRMDGVLALTRSQAEQISTLYRISLSKIHVVGGGYDEGMFSPAVKESPPPVEILYAGKLSRAKGVPWLLRSLVRVMDLPWCLHLAGQGVGPEALCCRALAEKLGGRVVFHGALSHGALSSLMKRSHLFVLPSFFEGLPLVLLEALACGCRLVATSLPGVCEVLGQSGGEWVHLVDLPPLERVDAPYAADEAWLEESLAVSLRGQLSSILASSGGEVSLASEILAPHTWTGVFHRIQRAYEGLG